MPLLLMHRSSERVAWPDLPKKQTNKQTNERQTAVVPCAQRRKGRNIRERVPGVTSSREKEVRWAKTRRDGLWRHGWGTKAWEGMEASSVTRGKAPSHAGKGGEAETNRGGLLKSPSQKVF